MYLAHYDKAAGRKQTLLEHSKNVSVLCRKYGQGINCPCLAELCGYLHDLGKAKKEFQNYLTEENESGHRELRGRINHSCAGAKYIIEKYGTSSDSTEKYTAQIIALSICSHHSGLPDCINPNGENSLANRIHPNHEIHYAESVNGFSHTCLSIEETEQKFQKAVGEITAIKNRISQTDTDIGEKLFDWGLITRYLLSCITDADRFDTMCFSDNIPTEEPPDITNDKWNELLANLETALDKKIPRYDIDKLRKEISLACKTFGNNKSGIYRLNVPTGGGKTFSSLRYALTHAAKWNKKRIFYVIPFTTIIDQNAEAIREALCKTNPENNDLILEHHSNLIYDSEENDTDRNYRLLTERWDSPIILTTTVQMLNTLFLDKMSSVRRMHNLENSILIFDEVQAIPVKCLSLFNAAMNFLAEFCGSSIILCTATQPRLEYIKPPLRLSEPADIVHVDMQKFKRTEIIDSRHKPDRYSASELAEFVRNKLEKNDTILVILNTKKAVRKLYTQLNSDETQTPPSRKEFTLYYLTTELCQAHRQKRLKEIRNKLTINPKPKLICLSTQLIEAGVDISFDCVIRSCSGIDSISQSTGRCNRNGEVKSKDVFIINSADEDLRRLPDISLAKAAAEYQLDEYSQNPASFENAILSPKMIDGYYRKYFTQRKNETEYNITKEMVRKKNLPILPKGTIYNLLSFNKGGIDAYKRQHTSLPYYLCQAFATAGKLFTVIEQDTLSVIINYEKGEYIIQELKKNHPYSEKMRLLRMAQHYSVSIYGSIEQLLITEAILPIADTGAYTVNPLLYKYDNEFGLVSQSDNILPENAEGGE